MRKVLPDDIVAVLHSRISLSRTFELFSSALIAREWRIGRRTMYRYLNKEDREKSREYAREKRRGYQPASLNCDCGVLLREHKRCDDCTALLHMDARLCRSCIASRERQRLPI